MPSPIVITKATVALSSAKEILSVIDSSDGAIDPNQPGNPNMVKKLAQAVCELAEAVLKL